MAFNYFHSSMAATPETNLPPAEDAITLTRAIGHFGVTAPEGLRDDIRATEEITRGYVRAQVLAHYSPATEASKGRHQEPVSPLEQDTGELLAVAPILGRKPTLKEWQALDEAADHARVDVARVDEEREKALQLPKTPFTPPQAAVARMALREVAAQGDLGAQDLLARRPAMLKPQGGLIGQTVLLPAARLSLARKARRSVR